MRDDTGLAFTIGILCGLLIGALLCGMAVEKTWKVDCIQKGIAYYTPEGTFQLKTNAAPVLRFEE